MEMFFSRFDVKRKSIRSSFRGGGKRRGCYSTLLFFLISFCRMTKINSHAYHAIIFCGVLDSDEIKITYSSLKKKK